jgi:hypothetical protein
LLQLAELLYAELSGDSHMEDQDNRSAVAGGHPECFPFGIRERKRGRRLTDHRVDVLRNVIATGRRGDSAASI